MFYVEAGILEVSPLSAHLHLEVFPFLDFQEDSVSCIFLESISLLLLTDACFLGRMAFSDVLISLSLRRTCILGAQEHELPKCSCPHSRAEAFILSLPSCCRTVLLLTSPHKIKTFFHGKDGEAASRWQFIPSYSGFLQTPSLPSSVWGEVWVGEWLKACK